MSAPAETPPAAEPRTPIYRCNTEGCSAGDCENCLAVAELRAALEAGAADTPKRSNSVLLWAADAALQTWQRGLPMEVAMGDLDLALNAFRGPDDEPSAFAAPLTETTDG
ncbi:hypothetical protein [Humibacter sp.]|uniref:hypothetical protein n=1 Tax=Humibacter sp. TaxID=1940291 RepID=UPI003F80C173